jgi:hypothetical protein
MDVAIGRALGDRKAHRRLDGRRVRRPLAPCGAGAEPRDAERARELLCAKACVSSLILSLFVRRRNLADRALPGEGR